MKRTLIAAGVVAAFTLGVSSPSFAQGAGVQIGPVGAGIEFSPEQRTRIKEYVVKERVAPVTVRERITVGATLPAEVELRTVPSDWGPNVTRYRYVYHDNHVVLVEPSNRKVIQILE